VPATAGAPQAAQRDLDGVYQFGHQVGSVIAAEVSLSTGKVTFGRLYNAASFDASKAFEHKDLVLHINQIASETTSTLSGGPVWMEPSSFVASRLWRGNLRACRLRFVRAILGCRVASAPRNDGFWR